MASTAAAAASAMAAQVASLSLGSSPSTSLTSSFTGTLVPLRRHVVVPSLRARNLTVQAKGGFIPAQHRWMYEGVEKMGPVRISPPSAPMRFEFWLGNIQCTNPYNQQSPISTSVLAVILNCFGM
jgi:hypothetical protein